MNVEIRRDQNYWGEIKHLMSKRWPGAYRAARVTKDRLTDLARFPYTTQKEVGDIQFRMMVGTRVERGIVDGLFFEEAFLGEMLECISPGDVVCDIGAACGTHTIPAAIRTGPDGIVFSFEPDQAYAKALRRNLALNRIPGGRVVVLETALWNTDAQLIIHTDGRRGECPQVAEEEQSVTKKFRHQHPIQARSLSSLVEDGTVRPPDVVKIDVEGAGERVLAGLVNLRPRHVFMEVHPLFGENRETVAGILGPAYGLVSENPRDNEVHLHFALS